VINLLAGIGVCALLILAVRSAEKLADVVQTGSLRRKRIHDDLNKHTEQIRDLERRINRMDLELTEVKIRP